MKRLHLLWAVPCLIFLLTGCGIEPALSGKARDEYVKSIKPYLQYWEKEGMTVEGRRDDWVECGGSSDGSFSPYIGLLNKERRPEEKDRSAAHYRLDNELQRCMLKKVYRYTGKCYDNEISRASPACSGMKEGKGSNLYP